MSTWYSFVDDLTLNAPYIFQFVVALWVHELQFQFSKLIIVCFLLITLHFDRFDNYNVFRILYFLSIESQRLILFCVYFVYNLQSKWAQKYFAFDFWFIWLWNRNIFQSSFLLRKSELLAMPKCPPTSKLTRKSLFAIWIECWRKVPSSRLGRPKCEYEIEQRILEIKNNYYSFRCVFHHFD